MQTWPMTKKLATIFPEYRVIHATKLAIKVMPALAVLCFSTQFYVFGWQALPQILASSLFILCLPLQGLYWLGFRALHPLPLSLLDWGNQLTHKLLSQGVHCQPLTATACYLDMAQILKLAFDKLEEQHWESL